MPFLLLENIHMLSATINRLKRDSIELEWFAIRYRKQGRMDLVHKMLAKKIFIDDQIAQLEEGWD
jgi:hypothetical protein